MLLSSTLELRDISDSFLTEKYFACKYKLFPYSLKLRFTNSRKLFILKEPNCNLTETTVHLNGK